MNLYKFLDSFFRISAKAAPDDKGTNYAEQSSKPFENADNGFLSDIRLTELLNAASAESTAVPEEFTAFAPVGEPFGSALFSAFSENAANAAAKNAEPSAYESGAFTPFSGGDFYRKTYAGSLLSYDNIEKVILSDSGSARKAAENSLPIITEPIDEGTAKKHIGMSAAENAVESLMENAEFSQIPSAIRTAAELSEAVYGKAAQIHKLDREPHNSAEQAIRAAETTAVRYGVKAPNITPSITPSIAASIAPYEARYGLSSGTVPQKAYGKALAAAGAVFLSAEGDKGGRSAAISAENVISPQKAAISGEKIIPLPKEEKKTFTSAENILPLSASVYAVNLNPKPTEAAIYKVNSATCYSGGFDGANTENTLLTFAENFVNLYQPVSEAALQTGYTAAAMAETETPAEQDLINSPQKEITDLRESAAEVTEKTEEKIIREIRLSALNTVNSLSDDSFGVYTDMDSIISSLAEAFRQTAATGTEGVYGQ